MSSITASRKIKSSWIAESSPRLAALICLGLFTVTFLAYLPALHCDFIDYDDADYVFKNPHVQAGLTLSGVRWAFQTSFASNWHPLTWLSHMLDYQLYGLNPWGHHLTNILFHCANATLLFLVLRRMTQAVWPSACIAALFAWHPLHVESVAWVAERKDVLSTFFILLTILAYTNYLKATSLLPAARTWFSGARSTWYYVALLLFALCLMSKPMFVTLPFLLLLLDIWPLRRILVNPPGSLSKLTSSCPLRLLFLEKLPFLLLALVSSLITIRVQSAAGAVSSLEALPLTSRLSNIPISYVRYIFKTLWPSSLCIYYPFPAQWPVWQVLGALVMLLAVSALAIGTLRTRPWLAVGWFFFLIVLLPVIGLVQAGTQAMADRYSYTSVIGLFILVVWQGWDWTSRSGMARSLASTFVVAVLLTCLGLTRHQLQFWRNTGTVFAHAAAVTTDNFPAHLNLGAYLESLGREQEALTHYLEGLRIAPRSPNLLNNLGLLAYKKGNTNEAIGYLKQSIEVDPKFAEAHNNLGNVLAAQGDLEGALRQYTVALSININYAEAHNNFGRALELQGKLPEAEARYRTALKINARYAEARRNLGGLLLAEGKDAEALEVLADAIGEKTSDADVLSEMALTLVRLGRLDAAIDYLIRANRANPGSQDLHGNLGNAYATRGKLDEAVAEYTAALKINPDFAEAHFNLANVLNTQGNLEEAVRHYNEALRLRPDYSDAHLNLAEVLSRQEKFSNAVEHLTRAISLNPGNPETHYRLGMALEHLEKWEDARLHYLEALRLAPNYPEARRQLDKLRSSSQKP